MIFVIMVESSLLGRSSREPFENREILARPFSESCQAADYFSAEVYSCGRVREERDCLSRDGRLNDPACEIAELIVPEIGTEEWPDSSVLEAFI